MRNTRITANLGGFTAKLNFSAVEQVFYLQLPLILRMEELNCNEKCAYPKDICRKSFLRTLCSTPFSMLVKILRGLADADREGEAEVMFCAAD